MTKLISYLVSAMMMLSAFIGTPVFAEGESENSGYHDLSDCTDTITLENGKSYLLVPKEGDSNQDVYIVWKSINKQPCSVYWFPNYKEDIQSNLNVFAYNNYADYEISNGLKIYSTTTYLTVSDDDILVGMYEYIRDDYIDDDGKTIVNIKVGMPLVISDLYDITQIEDIPIREIPLQEGQTISLEKSAPGNNDESEKTKATTAIDEFQVQPYSLGSSGTMILNEESSSKIDDYRPAIFNQMSTYSELTPDEGDKVEIHCDSGSFIISVPYVNLSSFKFSGLFEDIPETMWYHDVVYDTFKYGLMTGTDSSHFEPNSQMTRAMVATVLYRMAGSPEVTGNSGFSDVPDGMYYSDPVTWAVQAGVVTGYTTGDKAGTFGPNDNVTREQLCTMAYRYLDKVAGKDTSARADLDGFNDKDQVSGYAVDAVKYCVAKGIISGAENGTMLYPLNNATRAECAKILLNTSQVD